MSTLSLAHSRPTPASMGVVMGSVTMATQAPLHSDDLLQGQKTVSIVHNGSTYRLQATKLGKLILTK